MSRNRVTYAVGALLSGLPALNGGKTYAPLPVWQDSTTSEARFAPLPKKQAARIWHKARRYDRQTRRHGQHGGVIGRTALNVLYALLFDFLDYRTGRLDPSYDGIARRAGLCRRAVATALQRLKTLGLLHWLRRCTKEPDDLGRFKLRQETNAYAILPPSQWRGYAEPPEPNLHPTEWGAVPCLPSAIDQASIAHHDGDGIRNVLAALESDPDDRLAAAVAAMGRALHGLNH